MAEELFKIGEWLLQLVYYLITDGILPKYFPENSSQYDWVRAPFNAPALTGFGSGEDE